MRTNLPSPVKMEWLFTLHNNMFLVAGNIRGNNNHRVTGKCSKKNQVSVNLGLLCVVVRMNHVPHWLVYCTLCSRLVALFGKVMETLELKPC